MPRSATRATPPRTPDPERQASLELIRVLVGRLSSSARAVERHTGVTNAQLFLLQQLASDDTLSVNDLAGRAHTQQSTVSIVISRLVRAGLVRKARDARDARRAVLTLTTPGRRLLRNAPAPPTATLIAAVESLPLRDVRALATGLRALVRKLGPIPRKSLLLFEDAAVNRSRSRSVPPST